MVVWLLGLTQFVLLMWVVTLRHRVHKLEQGSVGVTSSFIVAQRTHNTMQKEFNNRMLSMVQGLALLAQLGSFD